MKRAADTEVPIADIAIQAAPDHAMSRADYHSWVDAQPGGRFERIEGRVVAMAPERRSHAKRKALVWLALHRAVEEAALPCEVYPDGMTIEVDDNDFEPDAILRCGEALTGDGISIQDPLVVVEILSPSARSVDLSRKMVAYFRVPSVQHYLIFWPDRPQVIHHQRQDGSESLTTRVVTGGAIQLDPPGIAITLASIYPAPLPR